MKKTQNSTQVTIEKTAKQKAFLPFVALFAVLGALLIVLSYAAVQKDYTIEPENGTLSAAVVAFTDSATGASYVTNKLCDTGLVGTPPNCKEGGWTAQYFANTTLSGTPRITRTEANLSFNYGAGSPDASIPADGFSARFTRVQTLTAGMYNFTAVSDDGVRVSVNGKQVINNWTDHGQTTDTGMLDLPAGTHTIVVEYYENVGDAIVSLTYGVSMDHGMTTPTNGALFTQNFDAGTTAASVNMTDIAGNGIPVHRNPDGSSDNGKIVIAGGRVNADPNSSKTDTYATANVALTANQFAEADLITGTTLAGQYTGIDVRANITGPDMYSWYKLETVESSTQIRILALKNSAIAAEYYAQVPDGLQPNSRYRLRLEVIGNQLRGYVNCTVLSFNVNGTLTNTVTDNNIASGNAGLHIYGTQSFLDNFAAGNVASFGCGAATPAPTAPAPATPAPTAPAPAPTPPVVSNNTQSGGPYVNNALLPASSPGDSARRQSFSYGDSSYYADGVGAFRTRCYFSHMSYDDPIVYPGQPGRAHLHTFFGNTGANAYSTTDSLTTTGNSTCYGGIINRSSYWIPSMIAPGGRPVVPSRMTVYYKTGYRGVPANQVQRLPAGLRMIAGDASRTTPNTEPSYNRIAGFACVSRNDGSTISGSGSGIPYCDPSTYLTMSVEYPQCWNGRDLDSADHKSHMAYAQGDGIGCPASHPVAIAAISFNVYWEPEADMAQWRLSSDRYTGGQGGYSAHGDWWNGWDQGVMDTIRNNCWLTGLDCRVEGMRSNQGLTCNPNLVPSFIRSQVNFCFGP